MRQKKYGNKNYVKAFFFSPLYPLNIWKNIVQVSGILRMFNQKTAYYILPEYSTREV